MLELNKTYSYDKIEKIIQQQDLLEKKDGELGVVTDDLPDGEIGEIVMPLYFDDGTVACNFILTGYSPTSFWKCIYVCQALEE